jgi:dethiobiotin synthetase
MNKKIFITGTNTEVGKTFITKNLIERIQLKGYSVSPYKPVETGCIKKSLTLIPRDSMIYFRAVNKKIALDQINPYRFLEPISPAAAIKRSKRKVTINDYLSKLKDLPNGDLTIIEGAGGLCSPLAPDGYNIDLIRKAKVSTVLVAKDEIGVINNVILSLSMLQKYKIKVLAIVLNRKVSSQPDGMNNYQEIKSLTKVPLIQILNKKEDNDKEFKKLIKIILA